MLYLPPMTMPILFSALSDPTRCEIVAMLRTGERDVSNISDAFAMSGPAVSQHLKKLRDAGLVRVRVQAQKRFYSLDKEAMAEGAKWLARMAGFWEGRLDKLEKVLQREVRRE
jgi:DNA-binding transcriptional ArsR family regulator